MHISLRKQFQAVERKKLKIQRLFINKANQYETLDTKATIASESVETRANPKIKTEATLEHNIRK